MLGPRPRTESHWGPERWPHVIVRNMPYQLPPEEFHDIVARFGDIFNEDTAMIYERGCGFVTYWDVRAAQRAIEALPHITVRNRAPKAAFANPPAELRVPTRRVSFDPARDPMRNVPIDRVREICSEFGEIETIMHVGHGSFKIDFFDARAQIAMTNRGDSFTVDGLNYRASPWGQAKDKAQPTLTRAASSPRPPPVPPPTPPPPPVPQPSPSRAPSGRQSRPIVKLQKFVARDIPGDGVEAVLRLREKLKS